MKAAELDKRPEFPLMKQGDIVSFYHLQMPRWLFTESRYKSLSLEAKVAYTFLLNRFQLSRINGWVNEAGEVFIVFTRESLAQEMQVSYRKAIDSFKELVTASLIWERRLGRGRPNQIYLAAVRLTEQETASHASAPFRGCEQEPRPAKTAHQQDSTPVCDGGGKPGEALQDLRKSHIQKCESRSFRPAESAHPDLPESHPSYIDFRKKDLSKNEVSQSVHTREDAADDGQLQMLYEQSELWVLPRDAQGVFQNAIERLFYSDHLKVGAAVLPRAKIRSHLRQVDGEVVQDAYAKLKANTERKIKNSTAYVMTVLLNSVWEVHSDLLVDPYLNQLELRPPQAGSLGGDPPC